MEGYCLSWVWWLYEQHACGFEQRACEWRWWNWSTEETGSAGGVLWNFTTTTRTNGLWMRQIWLWRGLTRELGGRCSLLMHLLALCLWAGFLDEECRSFLKRTSCFLVEGWLTDHENNSRGPETEPGGTTGPAFASVAARRCRSGVKGHSSLASLAWAACSWVWTSWSWRMAAVSCFAGATDAIWSTKSWTRGCINSAGLSTLLGTALEGLFFRCMLSAMASRSNAASLMAFTNWDRKTDSGIDRVGTTPMNRPSLRARRANSAAPWRVKRPIGTVKGFVPARPRLRDQAVRLYSSVKSVDIHNCVVKMGRCLIPIWKNDNFWVGHFMNITGMCPRIFLRTTMPPLRTPIVKGSVPRLMLAPMPRHCKITEQNELQELRKVLGRICTNVASSLWIQNINQALFLKTGNNGSILIQRLKKEAWASHRNKPEEKLG